MNNPYSIQADGQKEKRMRDKEVANTVNEAARLQHNLANEVLKTGNRHMGWEHLYHTLNRLSMQPSNPEGDVLFITATLEFSDLSFALGKGFNDSTSFLKCAREMAQRMADRRSCCLINLHLGRLFYFAKQRAEAMRVFEEGTREAESLGDEDILSRAAEFIGLYYFIQGIFPAAKSRFEVAASSFESGSPSQGARNPSGPMWLSYCYAFMGHFHEAIGTLDYYRRLAIDRSELPLAITFRAVLAIILAMIKNVKEAKFHATGALQEATAQQNAMAMYFAKGTLAYLYFLEGRLKEASDLSVENTFEGESSGLIRQYASPMMLEMHHEFVRRESNYPYDYFEEINRIMREPNIHLRGVAMRLKAMGGVKDHYDLIESDLKASEDYLIQSGDPVQLAKTWIEMARLSLRRGDKEKARILAQKAWKGFSGYGDVFYPDDLRHLLAIKYDMSIAPGFLDGGLESFIDMIQQLTPSMDLDELLSKTIAATNRILGAERGCFFWIGSNGSKKKPEPKGLCNLSQADIEADGFKSNLSLVLKAFRENKLQLVRPEVSDQWPGGSKAILCIPIMVQGRVTGVFYHDNSYIRDCFDYFSKEQMLRIAQYLAKYIENIFQFSKRMEQKALDNQNQLQQSDLNEIIAESTVMLEIILQADRIARSESTVLILGETGVGKELMARRIHHKSSRHKHPYVIVDMTAIPENLFESELFGHEKGAFTGADHQRLGRIELAHHGTLFIDEIGETPKSVQAKLLRALEEKTIFRVGGNKPISSDFRLIAATNRDLAAEVAAGNFREDLYYRLNVLPLTVPPLRERKEDIVLLAQYYLNRLSIKYINQIIKLTIEDQAMLISYLWPGNVRELKNVIERAVLLWNGDGLNLNLPQQAKSIVSDLFTDVPTLDDMQRRYIRRILDLTDGKIGGAGGAAEILGMKRTSLNNRMKKLRLR
jgi:transcriptional regulator with GAF, ATPase, and Fis domain/tetratricopeptide (TPR) repeat protein